MENLEHIGGYAYFYNLTNAEGLENLNKKSLEKLPKNLQEQIAGLKEKHKLEEFQEVIKDRNMEDIELVMKDMINSNQAEVQSNRRDDVQI